MILKRPAGNYTIEQYDECLVYEAGSYTVMLPYASGQSRELHIINLGVGTITVKAQPLETVQGTVSIALAQYESAHLIDIELQKWLLL